MSDESSAAHELRERTSARSRWLIAIGVLLLACLAYWIVTALGQGIFAYPVRDVLLPGYNFAGDASLPPAEIKKTFDDARTHMLAANGAGHLWKVIAQIAGWLSFLVSSVITVLAGLYGQLVPPGDLKSEQLSAVLKKRSRRFVRWVGVLAAAAAILTGIHNNAGAEAASRFKAAEDAQTLIARIGERIESAKSAREARDALNELRIKLPQ